MKKKLLVLLSIATVSMVTVFAASSYMVEKPQMLSFDTQIGYATQVVKFDVDLGSLDIMQGSVSFGEKGKRNFKDYIAPSRVYVTIRV